MGQWIQPKLLWMKYGAVRYPEQTTTNNRVRVKFAETEGFVSPQESNLLTQFMRSISSSILICSLELRRELRLEAAAGLFELGFSPRHVSQQRVQLLWTQYQQSEHKYEQDFGTQTHDSALGNAWLVGNVGGCSGRLLFVSFHG